MKVTELFKYVIKRGMEKDPRGPEGVKQVLAEARKEYKKLSKSERWEFDEERLWNPYDDSRILNNPGDPEVKKVFAGINIDVAELLLVDRLNEKEAGIDLAIGHHPRGIGRPGLPDVMHIQKDFYEQWGVPINVGEQLMAPRIEEVRRAIMPQNHQQDVDAARLLQMPFMCTHSPTDIMVQTFVQELMDEKEPYNVGDVCKVLKELPEYRTATILKNGPRVIVGSAKNRAGKVVVKMAGGTGGAETLYGPFETAGVGTYICMHLQEKHIELAKKHHINVVVAGHMPSDSLGMNLMYGELEKKGKLEIVRGSGLIGPNGE